MEDAAEKIIFMVECLKKYNYPNIDSMDQTEIDNIFSPSNRQFFVSWILKQMDNEYAEVVEEATPEEIAEIICCHGFCSNSEKGGFMDGTIDEVQQYKIMYKMLKFMKTAFDSKEIENPLAPVTVENINELVQLDTNLFPMYGKKQTLDSQERAKLMKEFCKETEDIKNLLSTQRNSENASVNLELNQQLESCIENLERILPDFKLQALDIINSDLKETDKTLFGDNFEKTLAICASNVQTVLEFLQNTNVVMNLEDMKREKIASDDKKVAMMSRIATLCNEITALKNECDSE